MKKILAVFLICTLTLSLLCGCKTYKIQSKSTAVSNIKNAVNKSSVIYTNTKYGFTFSLPESWKGYTIINSTWEGRSLDSQGNGTITEKGPIISIRHPKWTAQVPRQDIPIMIFTINQWKDLQQDKFHIGAAPINPSELGRNNNYVFALPARYNFAFPEGYEEVENLLKGNPLKPELNK